MGKVASFVLLTIQAAFLLGSTEQLSVRVALGFLLISASSLFRLLRLASAGVAAPGASVFYAFVFSMLSFVPTVQFATGQWPWNRQLTDPMILRAQLVILLGVIAFECGYRLVIWSKHTWQDNQSVTRRFPVFLILLLASVSLVVFLAYVPATILLTSRVMYYKYILSYGTSFGLIINSLIQVPASIAILYATANYRVLREERRWQAPAIWIAIVVIAGACVNPVITPRYWLGSVVLGGILLVLARLVDWRRFNKWWISTILFSLLILYPSSDLFRHLELRDFSGEVDVAIGAAYVSGDYDSFVLIAEGAEFVEQNGMLYGRQLIGAILFFFPRSLWPGKPISTGNIIANEMGFRFENIASPLWVEGFVNLGYAGTFLFLLLFGAVMCLIDSYMSLCLRNVKAQAGGYKFQAIVLALIVPFSIFVLRGSLMNAIAYLSPIIIIWFVLSHVERLSVRQKSPIALT